MQIHGLTMNILGGYRQLDRITLGLSNKTRGTSSKKHVQTAESASTPLSTENTIRQCQPDQPGQVERGRSLENWKLPLKEESYPQRDFSPDNTDVPEV